MKAASHYAAIACTVALAVAPTCAFAETKPSPKVLYAIALDIDHDGKPDRAVLVAPAGTGSPSQDKSLMIGPDARVDLYIYLGSGNEKLNLARKPTFLKKHIVVGDHNNQIFPLKSRNGTLIVKSAYNLFSNWAPETMTIVHRKGEFLVGGFSLSYDLKNGDQGGCDIDFLTGKGVASKGLGKATTIKRKFKPIKLADWSAEMGWQACR